MRRPWGAPETIGLSIVFLSMIVGPSWAAPEPKSQTGGSLAGFNSDVTIYPAEQSMEVNRMTLEDGRKLGVVVILTPATSKQVADFYRSSLTKKGWTIGGDENLAAPAGMQNQLQALGYTGTQQLTFTKGPYVVETDIQSAGAGVTLSLSQTKRY